MAVNKDYYGILGVSKTSSEEEIRKSYRKLAMKYHPDKNKDPGSEEKFKEINEAYSVLGDKTKRANYDQFGSADEFDYSSQGYGQDYGNSGFASGFDNFNFEDIFSAFGFGESRRQRNTNYPEKGKDIEYETFITLEEAYNGTNLEVKYKKLQQCDGCNGSGVLNKSSSQCHICKGMGNTRTFKGFTIIERTCYACKGSGIAIENICKSCSGEGRKEIYNKVTVKIPSGIESGKKVRIKREGNSGKLGGQPGDFLLHVHLKKHKIFQLDGHNLNCAIKISLSQALLGDTIELTGIDGKKFSLELHSCIQMGEKITVPNKGMPYLSDPNKFGNIIVTCNIEMPSKLTEKQIDLIKQAQLSNNSKGFFSNIFSF